MTDKPKRKNSPKHKNTTGNSNVNLVIVLIVGSVVLLAIVYTLVSANNVDSVEEGIEIAKPTDPPALSEMSAFERGQAYWQMGRYADAAATFTTVIELEPQNAAARYWRARSYRGMGELGRAVDAYTALLDRTPDYGDEAWYGLAESYYELYRRTADSVYLTDALAAALQALDEAGDNASDDYHQLAGDIYYDLGNTESAIAQYQQIEAVTPAVAARLGTLR
jgi:tetratricopeptide (TPR) repeat protein